MLGQNCHNEMNLERDIIETLDCYSLKGLKMQTQQIAGVICIIRSTVNKMI